MKITLKTSENHSKVSENHSKKSENDSNRVNFTFWGSSQRESSFVSSCPSVRSPLKWNSLYWSDFHSFWSDFHSLWNDFHSVRVFLTLFTLLKSNHFTLLTLREHLPPPDLFPVAKLAKVLYVWQSGKGSLLVAIILTSLHLISKMKRNYEWMIPHVEEKVGSEKYEQI